MTATNHGSPLPASRPSAPPSDPTTVVRCNTLVNDGRHVCRFRAGHDGEHHAHCNVDSIWPPAPSSGDGDPPPPEPLKASGLTELEELQMNVVDFEEPSAPTWCSACGEPTPNHRDWCGQPSATALFATEYLARFVAACAEWKDIPQGTAGTLRIAASRLTTLASQRAARARAEQDAARWCWFRDHFLRVEHDVDSGGQFLYIADDSATAWDATFAEGYDHSVESLVDAAMLRATPPAGQPEAVSRDA